MIKKDTGTHQRKIHQTTSQFLSTMPLFTRATKLLKETALQHTLLIDHHTVIMGDFNIPLTPIGMLSRQKLNREMLELTDYKSNGSTLGPDGFSVEFYQTFKE